MRKLKLFTQPSCPKCPAAKEVVDKIKAKFDIEYYDIKTEDGLAEALSYDIMSTPSIVVFDDKGKIVKDWIGETPSVEELEGLIK
jgi:ribonucleoside-triphosphate reductase (formate)